MYKECKTVQSSERQLLIAESLSNLLQVKEYQAISVADICRTAGIPRNTFYRYFSDKSAVLTYLFNTTMDQILKAVIVEACERPGEEGAAYIAMWLRHHKENKKLWQLFCDNRMDLFIKQYIAYYSNLQAPAYELKFNQLMTKQILILSYGIIGILEWWRDTDYQQDELELAKQLCTVLSVPMIECWASRRHVEDYLSTLEKADYFVE